jgi:hypothetical protein
MRNLFTLIFLLPLFAVAQSSPEHVFTIKEKDFIAEGIAYNPVDKSFYVGSIHKKKIVKISSTGAVSDFVSTGSGNIGQVLGIHINVDKQELWACNNEGSGIVGGRAAVHRYDLRTGKLIRSYVYQKEGETHLFNDATLVNDTLYVSDTEFGGLYKINPANEKPELFIKTDQLQYANGITTIPNTNKIIVSAINGLTSVNTATKEITIIPFSGYYVIGIDGLYFYKNSFIGIQNVTFPVSINRFYLNANNDAIEKGELLSANHSAFQVPTTGALAGDWFYFIANSQLDNYEKGKIENPAKLEEVKIMRVKLK